MTANTYRFVFTSVTASPQDARFRYFMSEKEKEEVKTYQVSERSLSLPVEWFHSLIYQSKDCWEGFQIKGLHALKPVQNMPSGTCEKRPRGPAAHMVVDVPGLHQKPCSWRGPPGSRFFPAEDTWSPTTPLNSVLLQGLQITGALQHRRHGVNYPGTWDKGAQKGTRGVGSDLDLQWFRFSWNRAKDEGRSPQTSDQTPQRLHKTSCIVGSKWLSFNFSWESYLVVGGQMWNFSCYLWWLVHMGGFVTFTVLELLGGELPLSAAAHQCRRMPSGHGILKLSNKKLQI